MLKTLSVLVLALSSLAIDLKDTSSGLPTSGQWRNGFSLVDYDSDGRFDIIHSAPRENPGSLILYSRNHKNEWKPRILYRSEKIKYGDVSVGDLNSDGIKDFALGIHLAGILFLYSSKDGILKESELIKFPSRTIRITDLNQDGKNDVVALSEGMKLGSGLLVLLNQNGWKEQTYFHGSFGDDFEVADLDNDGFLEIVIAARSESDFIQILRKTSETKVPLPARSIVWNVEVGELSKNIYVSISNFSNNNWNSSVVNLSTNEVLLTNSGRKKFGDLESVVINGKEHLVVLGTDNIFLDGASKINLDSRYEGYSLRHFKESEVTYIVANFASENGGSIKVWEILP